MAKLNYDRDVRYLVERLKKTHGLNVAVKSGVNEWILVKDRESIHRDFEGSLLLHSWYADDSRCRYLIKVVREF